MGSPISPGEVISLINKAMDIYKKIKDQPDQMVKIGKRMPRLRDFLEELGELIDTKKHPGSLASLRPKQTKRLGELMKDVRVDVQQVFDLLKRWETNEGPGGLVWRFDWVAHVVYTLGSSPDKLDALYESIELHLSDINRFVTLLSAFAHNQALLAGNANAASGQASLKPKQPVRKPSPSPEPVLVPAKKKMDYKICFVDGYNIGRSRVAEAYVKLLREWTIATTGGWRIQNIHSAGISVKRPTDGCENELKPLVEKWAETGKFLNATAMDSLFDNKLFNYSYKEAVRMYVEQRNAVGIPKNLFREYDYIIAFTLAQQVKLYKLREALFKINKFSRVAGKGKIVLLGEYAKPGLQIYEPDGFDRKKWNTTTSTMKVACKAFLKKEFGWEQPAPTR